MFKRKFHRDFLIDGRPILQPDAGVEIEVTDIEDPDSGCDESGVMHPIILRFGVKSTTLTYSVLTRDEYQYMESLFAGKSQFRVDHWEPDTPPIRFTARRPKHTVSGYNDKSGLRRNYKFTIMEC